MFRLSKDFIVDLDALRFKGIDSVVFTDGKTQIVIGREGLFPLLRDAVEKHCTFNVSDENPS